ncbi:hypothetical protein GQ53DRAFT_743248 [Thozetella sp. PMI_491]|nr:hypothetical protein GQ53DRAFT_743248 [Thozetella sp. PMI_491]
MAPQPPSRAQVVFAPERPEIIGVKSVFLAGTTTQSAEGDWRETLAASLSHLPITLFNPFRADWDGSWREDASFAPFRGQVEWELDMQELADIVVIYFGPDTDAPISLLEFGLCARPNKALVACHAGYKKRGNVEIVCQKMGITFLDSVDRVGHALAEKLGLQDNL